MFYTVRRHIAIFHDGEKYTEAFINIGNERNTRTVLNKELLDFNDVINTIGGKLVYIKSGTTGHTFRGFDPTDQKS